MAHPCFNCGSECECHGDIDDGIVSKTPKGCNGCGCVEEEAEWRDSEYSSEEEEFDRDLADWENEQERLACSDDELGEEGDDE